MDTIPLLIDTDPGIDDALAVLMALADCRHRVVGLTIAAGNVGLAHTTRNALKLCEVAQRPDIPVFAGAAAPLLHASADAAFVHGQDGFGDIGYLPAQTALQEEHAALAIIRLARQYQGQIMLVALGPLTNIALALKLEPRLPQWVKRLVVMGGAVTAHGNMNCAAEFNIGYDAEAAHLVFSAFDTFDLCDWEATLRHGIGHAVLENWLAQTDTAQAAFFAEISAKTRQWSKQQRGEDWYCADGLAMAYALHPEYAEHTEVHSVAVELAGTHSRGATIVDWQKRYPAQNQARILMRYAPEKFLQLLQQALCMRHDNS